MTDWTLEGLDALRDRLTTALAAGRLHHALLLTGARGVGKKQVARAIAQGLLCSEQRVPGGCGTCGSCHRVRTDAHPDLAVVALPKGKSRIPVESVRTMIDELQMGALEGRGRVALLLDVDALGVEGQSSLLKTLEEPAPRTWLVLTCTRPERLLDTVRSRCEQIGVPVLPSERLAVLLQGEVGGDLVMARRLAGLAGGSLGLARELARVGDSLCEQAERFLAVTGDVDPTGDILSQAASETTGVRQARIDKARRLLAVLLRLLREQGLAGDLDAFEATDLVFRAEADLELGLSAEIVLSSLRRELMARGAGEPGGVPPTPRPPETSPPERVATAR